jgi:hypothetical protein
MSWETEDCIGCERGKLKIENAEEKFIIWT